MNFKLFSLIILLIFLISLFSNPVLGTASCTGDTINITGSPNTFESIRTDVNNVTCFSNITPTTYILGNASEGASINLNLTFDGAIIEEDTTLIAYGNITNYGNLTLQNVTIQINNSVSGENNITVFNGGNFYINESSNLTRYDGGSRWMLTLNQGSQFEMNDSYMSYAGWEEENPGFNISTNNVYMKNNTITFNHYGINVRNNSLQLNNLTIANYSITGIYMSNVNHTNISEVTLVNRSYVASTFGIRCYKYCFNTTIENSILNGAGSVGIFFQEGSTNTTIKNNIIGNMRYSCITPYYIEDTKILNNEIFKCDPGINFGQKTNNTNVTNNTFYNNTNAIEMINGGVNTTIHNNTFYNNTRGIIIFETSAMRTNITITNNILYENTRDIYNIERNEANGTIYNNIFNSTIFSEPINDSSNTNFTWNTTQQLGPNIIGGRDIGGNFYHNYTGVDCNSDGIGDISYTIPGTAGAIDYFPLTNNTTGCPPPPPPPPPNGEVGQPLPEDIGKYVKTKPTEPLMNISIPSNLTIYENESGSFLLNITRLRNKTCCVNIRIDGISQDWILTNLGSFSIEEDETKSINLTFKPDKQGEYSINITVSSPDYIETLPFKLIVLLENRESLECERPWWFIIPIELVYPDCNPWWVLILYILIVYTPIIIYSEYKRAK